MILFWVLILFVLIILALCTKSETTGSETTGKERAGKRGEKLASELLDQILKEEDLVVYNVKLEYEGKRAEIDQLIVTRKGIYIIEVKNYVGTLYGNSEEDTWVKIKASYVEDFEKEIYNPIKQVKREVYILSRVLKERGIYNRIEGYVFLLNDNPGIKDNRLLRSIEDVNRVIHSRGKESFSNNEFEYIKREIRELSEV